ncbi:MAG: lysine biosynthesis protein LysW [Actinomycetota bacterium]|nr:lysine biosynthesis protein LysW [Actinomycetota bacterium]
MSTCPDCTQNVAVPADARVSSIVVCPSCRMELEVIGVAPTELALAPEIEEDFGE